MDTATYVYCVVHRERASGLRGIPDGIPGGSSPVLLPVARRLWIVAAEVPRDAYSPQAIERHLRDLEWVSRIALAHERVVERMTRTSGATVIPMKMFTMFSTPELAVEEMRSRRRQLETIVRHIAGCREWGVRVRPAMQVAARPARTDAAMSGTAFLTAKRQARDGAREQTERMRAAAEDMLTSLRKIARDTKQRDAPEGAASPPLLDVTFLVPEAKKARFAAAVKKAAGSCREAGAELTLTGPWPAYNFIDPGDS